MSIEMQEILEKTIERCNASVPLGISDEQLACEIVADLTDAGYGKLDPYMMGVIEQLRHGLDGLIKNLVEIRERTEYLKMTEERCTTILRIIDYAKEHNSKHEAKKDEAHNGKYGLPQKITERR